MERDFFRPLGENYPDMPRELNYQTEDGQRISVVFGLEYGHPATRYSVTDESGRVIREGGSFAINFGHALSAGLGWEAGLKAIRVLRENHQVVLGPLATEQVPGGDNFGGRV